MFRVLVAGDEMSGLCDSSYCNLDTAYGSVIMGSSFGADSGAFGPAGYSGGSSAH